MYFKQIEILGFKSFADRTKLQLEPGITAVVGPNGCGKSNILDALRWCLGEQSAKALRASHMQDVIFNGSEHRGPTGMAEVTLVFDNADSRLPLDFAEVQITRRVYRSGESEYLINKVPCRLRDVQELFMDTGVGTNAYSLIGQGKIDLVLSSKPEDRRYLFEEAAGIIKYKTRKRVAMRKLDSAEQNLLRLGDIVGEVERQMRSLKRQANAAIRHRELTAAVRELEIRDAWLHYNELTGQVADLKERFAAGQAVYEGAAAEMSTLEARQEELNLKRIEFERILMARRDGEYQVDSEMERLENQVALSRREIEFAKQQQEQALQEHGELTARAEAAEEARERTEEEAGDLGSERARIETALAGKQEDYNLSTAAVSQAEEQLEASRSRALDTITSRNKVQMEIETLAVSVSSVDTQLTAIYARQKAQNARIEELTEALASSRARQSSKRESLGGLEARRRTEETQRRENAEKLETLNEAWQSMRESKSSEEARLESLRELRDSFEGFTVGVRAMMKAKKERAPEARGVAGPVGDLITTEQAYRQAIEAALGGNINNVVVAEAEAAKSAIVFLKENRAGRVTFLPLDTIRGSGRDGSGALAGQAGFVGKAINYVQCDSEILPALEYLLYDTVIVETLDDAIRIARSKKGYPRLVTLEGEVVSASGAVTGGRTRHDSGGLLGRGAEIEALEKAVAETTERIGVLARERKTLEAALSAAGETLAALEADEDALRSELGEIEVAAAKYATELESLSQSGRQLAQERDDLVVQREELEARRGASEAMFSTMAGDDAALELQHAAVQEAASKARRVLSECGDQLSELRIKLAGIVQRREETSRDRDREARAQAAALEEAGRREAHAERLQAEAEALELKIADNLERAKVLSETKEVAHAKVVEAQERQQAVFEELNAAGQTLKGLREKAGAAQKEVHRLEIELTHKEDRITFFQERILSEYNLVLASLTETEVGADEYDEAERGAKITECRAKLQRMGVVNLMAIEEYEALEERDKFLRAQEEDLQKARETLLSVVDRIDGTIREMFLETFRQVGENFKNYFRRLFSGGQARIYLLDEDDPLESGIEIEARPPGKKPQTISLLSGGEQALTAIALLFSIFSAKPSPFCVLDEVDAPLDDANIGRFLSLVDDFVDRSQFIIITHNKQTMEHADALFGITQQEQGVSQMVSVRIEEVGATDTAA